MAGALSRNLSNITQLVKLIDECLAMSIAVLGPDVNESGYKFSVNSEGSIRFGLNAIKGVSSSAVDLIVSDREERGAYQSVYDFFERIPSSVANKRTLESLILSGAFDSFGFPRELYSAPMDSGEDTFLVALIRYGQMVMSEQGLNEASLFGGDEEALQIPRPTPPSTCPEVSSIERLNRERDLIGIYLSGHPLDPHRVLLECYCSHTTAELGDLAAIGEGRQVSFGGLITKVYQGTTKRGDPYARITVEDLVGATDIAFFSESYTNFAKYCIVGLSVLLSGVVQKRRYGDELELKIHRVDLLSTAASELIRSVSLEIDVRTIEPEVITELSQLLAPTLTDRDGENNKGYAMLSIRITDGTGRNDVRLSYDRNLIAPTAALLDFCRHHGIQMSVNE